MYHLRKASNKYPVDLFADFDNRCISYNLYSVWDVTCYCNSHLEGKKNTLFYADGIILSKSWNVCQITDIHHWFCFKLIPHDA